MTVPVLSDAASGRSLTTAVVAALCVVGLVVLALDDMFVIPGPVRTFELQGSSVSSSLEGFYSIVLSTSEAAVVRSESYEGLYAVALSISGVAVVLGLGFVVGVLVGRWWTPLLLLLPLLAALSQIDGRDFTGSGATESVGAAAGLLAASYAAQVLFVLAGVGARKLVGRRTA